MAKGSLRPRAGHVDDRRRFLAASAMRRQRMKPPSKWFAAMLVALAAGLATGQPNEIRIAHIYGKTGPLEAYAKQTQIGLLMGLEYATGGKMELLGRKIVVIEKDDQLKPDIGKSHLA